MNKWDWDWDWDRDFTIHIDETRAIEVRAVSIKFRTKNLEFRIYESTQDSIRILWLHFCFR